MPDARRSLAVVARDRDPAMIEATRRLVAGDWTRHDDATWTRANHARPHRIAWRHTPALTDTLALADPIVAVDLQPGRLPGDPFLPAPLPVLRRLIIIDDRALCVCGNTSDADGFIYTPAAVTCQRCALVFDPTTGMDIQ